MNGSLEKISRYGPLFLFAGLACLVVGVVLLTKRIHFLSRAETAEGVVLELVERDGSDSTVFAPVFSFADRAGKRWTVTSDSAASPPAYSVGEKVRVYYISEEPKSAVLDGFFTLWGASTILCAVGLVHSFGGAFLVRLRNGAKEGPDQPPEPTR